MTIDDLLTDAADTIQDNKARVLHGTTALLNAGLAGALARTGFTAAHQGDDVVAAAYAIGATISLGIATYTGINAVEPPSYRPDKPTKPTQPTMIDDDDYDIYQPNLPEN